MITKKDIEELENLRKEQKTLDERIAKSDRGQDIIKDSVKGSSVEFPYTIQTCSITGFENDDTYRRRKKIAKKLKKIRSENKIKIDKKIIWIEYELKKIKDSIVREIIRYRSEGLTWRQIANKMNYGAEETPRSILDRYFEKNKRKK